MFEEAKKQEREKIIDLLKRYIPHAVYINSTEIGVYLEAHAQMILKEVLLALNGKSAWQVPK